MTGSIDIGAKMRQRAAERTSSQHSPFATPAGPDLAAEVVLRGFPPPTGKMLDHTRFTPAERKKIEELGVKSVEFTPTSLPGLLRQIAKHAREVLPDLGSRELSDAEIEKALQNVEQLSAADAAQVRKIVATHVEANIDEAEFKQALAGMEPEIQQELLRSRQESRAASQIASLPVMPPTPKPEATPAKSTAAAAPLPATAVDPEPKQQELNSGGPDTVPVLQCPCCKYELNRPLTTVITDQDMMRFVQCLASGELFEKSYSSYGGAVKVTFRELRGPERDVIVEEIKQDIDSNKIQTVAERETLFMRYLQMVQLVRLEAGDTPITGVRDACQLGVSLRECYEFMCRETVYGKESILNIVHRHFQQFIEFMTVLHARGRDANF